MKIAASEREIERFLPNVEKKFSIQASSHAFKILSSALYKDKILAIVRELSCNARDSHVESGRGDLPFQVHLPNSLEPYFSVRDDGLGLHPTDIETTYSTYFCSTKNQSNDLIGGLGLGSKTPFSYVDSFTVTSRFDGIQYVYAAFISENGEPSVVCMGQTPTLEGNGLEVKVSVKNSSDYSEFAKRAKDVLSRFNPRPIVKGCSDFSFNEHNIILSGDGWQLNDSREKQVDDTCFSIMGSVAYPIVKQSISSLSPDALNVYMSGIEIEFPIGSLEVTAGREDLSYSKSTLATLEAQAKTVRENARLAIQARFDSCSTEFEVKNLFSRCFYLNQFGWRLVGHDFRFSYRGKILENSYFVVSFPQETSSVVNYYNEPSKRYFRKRFGAGCSDAMVVHAEPNVKIVIDDLNGKRGGASRITFERKTNPDKNLIVISGNNEHISEILQQLDGFPIIRLSSMPVPPKAEKSEKITELPVFKYCDLWHRGRMRNDNWNKISNFDPTIGGIYVLKSGYEVLDHKGEIDSYFKDNFNRIKNLGLITSGSIIYGFSTKTAEKVIPQGNWISLHDLVRNGLIDLANLSGMTNKIRYQRLKTAFYYLENQKTYLERIVSRLNKNHVLSLFINKLVDFNFSNTSSVRINYDDYRTVRHWVGNAADRVTEFDLDDLTREWMDILKKYPLLQVLQIRDSKDIDLSHIVQYIQFADFTKV